MHQNDVFLFLKNYFWDQRIKTIQNIQKILIFSKKNKFEFFGNRIPKRFLSALDLTCFPNPHYLILLDVPREDDRFFGHAQQIMVVTLDLANYQV
jgi:hypothetical protein